MTNSSPFSTLSLRRQTHAPFESLLDQLTYAALIYDIREKRIRFANAQATELTTLTRAELSKLGLDSLFPMLDLNSSGIKLENNGQPIEASLKTNVRRNGPLMDVRLTPTFLDPEGKWVLLAIEPLSVVEHRKVEEFRTAQQWEALQNLAMAPQNSDFSEVLTKALEAGGTLTGADLLATYEVNSKDYQLERTAVWGPAELLPDQISPSDQSILQGIHVWVPGKRILSALDRAARASNFSYLASAPLAQENAFTGLLVIAGDQLIATDRTLVVLQFLAAMINSFHQNHVLAFNLKDKLQLQARELELGTTLKEMSHDAVVIIAPDLTIQELNSSAESILGYASREVRGQPYSNILVGADNLIPPFVTAEEGSILHNLGNVKLYRRDGKTFLGHVRTVPIVVEGELQNLLVLIQDLSQEEHYRLRNQQLEQRALLGEVTAIFAHEVRNPINNITTGLQLMSYTLSEEDPNHEVVARLQTDCDRLADMMKSVLNFIRPVEYKMEPVNLGTAIKRLLERWHPHLTRVNIQYQLQVEPGTPPIEGDPRALEQVWNNLISNAIQAMGQDGGMLAVKIRPATTPNNNPRVEVSISDTGMGIPEEIREHIFEPFYTTHRNGTGLGLAITKQIVNAHKGAINLTSIPGGTVFQVQLPVMIKSHEI
jgi:two-component system, NtrC family, sensor histidine kinase AtoS